MNPPKPSLIELAEDLVQRTTLPNRVYGELKRRILSGLIAPGTPLRETALCAQLKVSRTPLREALNRLGNEDLVDFRPNHGYVVAPLSAAGFRRLQDLRVIMESKVAALAAIRATEEDLHALRAAADMPRVIAGEDRSFIEFCRANARFHLLVVRAAKNHMLENVVMSALDQYQRPAYLGIGRVEDHTKPSRCHHDLVDAVEARDPIKAEAAMCNHVIGGSERIIRALISAGY